LRGKGAQKLARFMAIAVFLSAISGQIRGSALGRAAIAIAWTEELRNKGLSVRAIWLIAREREAVIAAAAARGGTLAARVPQGARALGISARTVRRLMQRYVTSAQT
jgi:hypothetical protein